MSNSPLLLDRYFFVKTLLEAQSKADLKAINSIETNVELSKAEGKPGDYLISLTVRLLPHEESQPAYLGEFVVMGFFKVHSEYPAEKCDKLVSVNGASMLYGVVREMVANLTARGPWPMLTLVAMSFSDVLGDMATAKEVSECQTPPEKPGA
jgi:preprotein translocase subunit SecB